MTKQPETRTCRLCNGVKPLELFEVDSRVKGGRTNRCRDCKHGLDGRAERLYRKLKQRANEDGLPLEVTRKELQALFAAFDGKCIYCGISEEEAGRSHHVDHVVPTSEGGRHHISNLVLSCASCNASKSDKPFFEFYLRKKDEISDENFGMLTHFIALTSGQPVNEVISSFLIDYIKHAYEHLSENLDERQMREVIYAEFKKKFKGMEKAG